MKRLTVLFLLLLFLAGCVTSARMPKTGVEPTLSIVSTIFVPYDFAREITGKTAELTMLLPPASDSHSYEPTARDILKVQNCAVFIYGGGESDHWVDTILASLDQSAITVVTMMDCVDLIEEEVIKGMEDNGGEDDGGYDEHVWTSPRNAKLIAQKICDAVCEANPENADFYRQNTAVFLQKLDMLDAAFQEVTGSAARSAIVFGDRFPFRYFTEVYNLTYFAAFPGCSSETEASAKTISFLIEKIKEEQLPVVFHIELSSRKTAEAIGEATGAKVLLLHACHNISRDDFLDGVTYLELMERNVEALKEALW